MKTTNLTIEQSKAVGLIDTVSGKIRYLDKQGYPRADIARALGKRYQHVKNVLDADVVKARSKK